MTNPTPGTQLARVLDLMLDGQWRSPTEIAHATGDREASTTSRIRDLRLSSYGSHLIESRKRNVTRQIWEYRLVAAVAPTVAVSVGAQVIAPVSLQTGPQVIAPAPLQTGPPVKFLNMNTMMVEQITRDRCQIDSSHGFSRVVAVDSNGSVLSNLVTTQNAL